MLEHGRSNYSGRKLCCSIVMLFCFFHAYAQNEFPSVRISLDVNNAELKSVIETIQEKSGIFFSYNPNRIPLNLPVTYTAESKLLSDVLKDVLGSASISYDFVEGKIVLRALEKQSSAIRRESVTLKGFVTDAANGEALIGATILFSDSQGGVVTNAFGFYSITISPGLHTVSFSFVGYTKIDKEIDLRSSTSVDVKLNAAPALLDEIVVSETSLLDRIAAAQVSNVPIKPTMISQKPALFGEADAVKSLEMVPGVKIHSDGSTFYYVRGGDKDQNLILVDDAPVFNPNHLLGIFSTLIPEAINDLTLYKGSMSASFGGRLSSILDIRTKKGNDQNFQAAGGIGLLSTKLTLEGPIKRDKISYLISGRRSRLKWISHLINENIQKFQFYDLTGKLNVDLSETNKMYLSFYNGSDDYFGLQSGINWANKAVSLRWNHVFNNRLFLNTTLAGGSYDYNLYTDISSQSRWHSHLSNINLKTDFSYFKSPKEEIDFGLSITGYNFNPGNFTTQQAFSPPLVSIKNSGELVLYGNHTVQLNEQTRLSYGLRLSSWTNQGKSFEFVFDENRNPVDTLFFKKGQSYGEYGNVEPRFTFSYQLDNASSLKFSYARNVQNIHLISNSISPFTSFEVWLPSSINIKPQSSNQVALGYFRNLSRHGIVLEVEGFLKKMRNQIDYETHAETLLNPIFEKELRFGEGTSHGIEILARKDLGKVRGLIGYSYARARRNFRDINEGRTYNAFYDRPHQINLVLSYDPTSRWNLGLNWNYSSGAPYSSPIGFYEYNGLEVPIYGQKNNTRLPDYHRLDISATIVLNKNLENKFNHSLTFSIYNLYARKNSLFVNYNKVPVDKNTYNIPVNLLDDNRVVTQFYLFRLAPSLTYNFKWR